MFAGCVGVITAVLSGRHAMCKHALSSSSSNLALLNFLHEMKILIDGILHRYELKQFFVTFALWP